MSHTVTVNDQTYVTTKLHPDLIAVLESCDKPIILDDTQRQILSGLAGRNLSTGKELVSFVTKISVLRLDECEVPVSAYLLDRLKSRCIGVEFNQFLSDLIKRLLEQHVGIR